MNVPPVLARAFLRFEREKLLFRGPGKDKTPLPGRNVPPGTKRTFINIRIKMYVQHEVKPTVARNCEPQCPSCGAVEDPHQFLIRQSPTPQIYFCKCREELVSVVDAGHHPRAALDAAEERTSGFSKPAQDYVRDIQDKVVLIDRSELVDLLIEYGIGVSNPASYEIKKVDLDHFADER